MHGAVGRCSIAPLPNAALNCALLRRDTHFPYSSPFGHARAAVRVLPVRSMSIAGKVVEAQASTAARALLAAQGNAFCQLPCSSIKGSTSSSEGTSRPTFGLTRLANRAEASRAIKSLSHANGGKPPQRTRSPGEVVPVTTVGQHGRDSPRRIAEGNRRKRDAEPSRLSGLEVFTPARR